jgi:hypothetical protein
MDMTPLPPTDRIVRCTADQWTEIPRPTTGVDASAFDDAERQLRAKHPGRDAENWQTKFRIRGDVTVATDLNGLHFIPHDSARPPSGLSGNVLWKAKVMLMDASSVKAENGFTWDREGLNKGKATLNGDVT